MATNAIRQTSENIPGKYRHSRNSGVARFQCWHSWRITETFFISVDIPEALERYSRSSKHTWETRDLPVQSRYTWGIKKTAKVNIDTLKQLRYILPPTPVFLPGKVHGQRSLVDCSPWGYMTEPVCTRVEGDRLVEKKNK